MNGSYFRVKCSVFLWIRESKFLYIVRVAKVPHVEGPWETVELIKYIS